MCFDRWTTLQIMCVWLGTDDRCEPQPIPKVVVGHEKDWLSVAPYALHYWEKLLLEPYSYSRDVAYVVVAPDNDYILSSVRNFFRELSSTYEVFTCTFKIFINYYTQKSVSFQGIQVL